jgi:hypothetical protein
VTDNDHFLSLCEKPGRTPQNRSPVLSFHEPAQCAEPNEDHLAERSEYLISSIRLDHLLRFLHALAACEQTVNESSNIRMPFIHEKHPSGFIGGCSNQMTFYFFHGISRT